MVISSAALPNDIEALKRLLRARDAELAQARAEASNAEALIAHLRLTIEKMRREVYGQRSERSARLLDQMELELEELEAAASEDELAAERVAAAAGTTVGSFSRKRPSRKPRSTPEGSTFRVYSCSEDKLSCVPTRYDSNALERPSL